MAYVFRTICFSASHDSLWYPVVCPRHTSRLRQVNNFLVPESVTNEKSPDVVKTRLQVEARKGQTNYKGLTDAFVKICERGEQQDLQLRD